MEEDPDDELGKGMKWKPFHREYTKEEGKRIIAKVLEVAIKTTFKNHIYSFKNELFKQEKGGAIGLRLTGVVARILMDRWAEKFIEILQSNGVEIHVLKKYVDDVNLVTEVLKKGLY